MYIYYIFIYTIEHKTLPVEDVRQNVLSKTCNVYI